MQMIATGIAHKNRLGIEFLHCHTVDVNRFTHPVPKDPNGPKFEEMRELLRDYPFFDSSYHFHKGFTYIVICIIHAGWTVNEATQR